jgi:hypothetical protein
MAITAQDVTNYLQANPGMSDAQIAAAMQQFNVSPQLMSQATGVPVEQVQARMNTALATPGGPTGPVTIAGNPGFPASSSMPRTQGSSPPPITGFVPRLQNTVAQPTTGFTAQDVTSFLQNNPGMSDAQIAEAMRQYNISPQLMSQATGVPLADVQSRYFQTTLPAPLPAGTPSGTGSRIDPALMPYLQMGLQRAQQLFLTGQQPEFFPGQTYVSPSAQTLQALSQQEAAAGAAQPLFGQAQQAYQASLGQIGQTAAGGFLQGSPYRQAMIESATRPLQQQFESQILPGISSGFSRAGRYGSGAMQRAVGQASEQFGRALGDVATNIAYTDYARERAAQQQAQVQQAALAQAAPSFFTAGLMPSQTLAQVGAAREAIAAQPLQEQMQRFQFGQQLPYQQLQGFLSSVYGTPMGSSQYGQIPQAQTNRLGQAVGLGTLGYLGGQALGGQTFGIPNQFLGAAAGGLLGYGL